MQVPKKQKKRRGKKPYALTQEDRERAARFLYAQAVIRPTPMHRAITAAMLHIREQYEQRSDEQ